MKQVIVMRKDLNMRKGKMIAQGCHASLGAARSSSEDDVSKWLNGMYGRKICVYVESEAELLAIGEKASEAGLNMYIVKDRGLTEFKEPTYTCLCIGPNADDDINKITGELPLL